ncbi:MAG: hypothetical protein Q9174_000755 [Haloplaca sp. 1 TL-2023]
MAPENHVAAQSRLYEAAESMLQHARSTQTQHQGLNGFALPNDNPSQQPTCVAMRRHSPDRQLSTSVQHSQAGQPPGFDPLRYPSLSSPREPKARIDGHCEQVFAVQPLHHSVNPPVYHRPQAVNEGSAIQRGSAARSEPSYPMENESSANVLNSPDLNKTPGGSLGKKSGRKATFVKEEDEKAPSWSELKTKAGKDRKRLPLACIACRRKKIRCSGERPACRHCLRSRIPCVYKVSTRKAAPRTDYMAMLDKRLKRMEERVIKVLPGDEPSNVTATSRAQVRPPAPRQLNHTRNGRKRQVEEAFGPELDELPRSRLSKKLIQNQRAVPPKHATEGLDKLPTMELQEHLAEVYFSQVYGQSYLLLHKPSFMERLRYVQAPRSFVS